MIKVRILRSQGHPTDFVHAAGEYGTALQVASYRENLQVVKLLLDEGADPNAQGAGVAMPRRSN
jgi:hypothetical protein